MSFDQGTGEELLRKLDLRVKQVMKPGAVAVSANSTVANAARVMERGECGCCLVESQGRIVGIVTERDIVRRVAAKGASLSKTKVRSIMTSPIIVTNPQATVEQALKAMADNRIRRLPVVDKEGLVGIVSIADIAKGVAEKAGFTSSLLNVLARQTPPPEGLYA